MPEYRVFIEIFGFSFNFLSDDAESLRRSVPGGIFLRFKSPRVGFSLWRFEWTGRVLPWALKSPA